MQWQEVASQQKEIQRKNAVVDNNEYHVTIRTYIIDLSIMNMKSWSTINQIFVNHVYRRDQAHHIF